MKGKLQVASADSLEELLDQLGLGAADDAEHHTLEDSHLANAEEVRAFLAGVEGFRVGDIITWRPGLRNINGIKYGDKAIVTQVLPTPVRMGDTNMPLSEPLTLAVAFYATCGDPECPDKRHFHESLVDARRFTKVGSIYND